MGVEILNNFAEGCYSGSAGTVCELEADDCAGNNSFVENSGNDVVRYTLKSKVMERLKNRGLDNITADFTPKPSYPMTEEEKDKDKRRKQSNRESAQRSRDKQKKEDKRHRQLLERLKEEHQQLLNKVNESEREKSGLLYNLKQMLPDCYIQEALSKIKYVTNGKEDLTDRMESRETNEQETAIRRDRMDISYSNEELVQNDYTFTEHSSLEENCLDGEYFFSSLHSVADNGIVEFLEVGNEETVQFLHDNLVSIDNGDVQSYVFEQQEVQGQNLAAVDGTVHILVENSDQII